MIKKCALSAAEAQAQLEALFSHEPSHPPVSLQSFRLLRLKVIILKQYCDRSKFVHLKAKCNQRMVIEAPN